MSELTMTDDWGQRLSTELDEREQYRLLADERRRTVLDAIAEIGDSVEETTLGELSSAVDRLEQRGAERDESARQSLLVELHHVHLPLMDDVGVVDYDSKSKRIDLAGVALVGE